MTHDDLATQVGRRIKARREALRLAQREVAERLVGPGADEKQLQATLRAYQRWEAGRGSLRHLGEAAEALSTSPEALMGASAPVPLPPDAPLDERVARLEAQVGDLLAVVEGVRQFLASPERVLAEADALLGEEERRQTDFEGNLSAPPRRGAETTRREDVETWEGF